MNPAIAKWLATHGIAPRADVRRAVLAAAETCWVYAGMLTVGRAAGSSRFLTAFGIWFTYWAALEIGHYLPRRRQPLRVLRLLNLGLAILIFLAVIRLDLYRDVPLLDLSWVGAFVRGLSSTVPLFTPPQIAIITLLYVYVRGSGFGQRPLTLWFVGFQFRLGVLIFFIISLLAVLTGPPNLLPPLVAYFVLSLLGVALSRIDESGREKGLGMHWAVLLIAACAVVVLIALFVTPLFTLTGVNLFFRLFEPLLPVLAFLLAILLIPLGWVFSLLIDLLAPLFAGLSQVFKNLQIQLPEQVQQPLKAVPSALSQLLFLVPYLQLLLFIALIFGAAVLVARALNRRMMQAEEEGYFREPVESLPARPKEKPRRTPRGAKRRGEIQAENIRRIYAALLARAAALGLARREAETPLEFLPRLVGRFPQAEADLRMLTDAYVSVHYGEQAATSAQVREARLVWGRAKREMREDARTYKH